MMQLWLDGEMDSLKKYSDALGFIRENESVLDTEKEDKISDEPSIRPMWESDYDEDGEGNPAKQCHDSITQGGFFVYLAARNKLFNGGSFGYTLSEMSTLASESGWPDSGDVGFLWDRHFYDPDTQKSWNIASAHTARSRAEYYYEEAVRIFPSNRTESIKYLAYSLHYIQDVAVPHHAANKKVGSSNHKSFESLASQMLLGGELQIDLEEDFEYDINFYNQRVVQSVGLFVHEIASNSKPLISVASDTANILGQRIVIAFMINYSMLNTSGILYKFANEVNMI